jgi:DNA mismatch repair protein MutL
LYTTTINKSNKDHSMSSKIRVLSELTINKIAAGEVVENPASVVKELVENALDAGATEICIEIKGGGRQLIRISDNGCGMSGDDALLCLERHATSKIKEVEDVYGLMTMGFRGEAIPSIAAISKFTLLTCLHKEGEKNQDGTMVIVEGGQILSCTPAIRSSGTTIEVKSLFFNIPVRKKFQKSPAYDTQEILKIIGVLSLGYPSIQFELISDHKCLLKTPILPDAHSFQEKLANRIETVLGRDFFSGTCPLSFHKESYHIEGYIGLPAYTRHNRTGQYIFINQRAIYSPLISFAVREGYGTTLAQNRHPVFVLHLQMPGSLIDVNVHPQKKEVRLRQELILKDQVIQAVQAALQKQGFSEDKTPFQTSYESLLSPLPALTRNISQEETEFRNSFYPSFSTSAPEFTPQPSIRSPPFVAEAKEPFSFFPLTAKKSYPRVLNTICGFILMESSGSLHTSLSYQGPEGFYIVDQKAAYSRIHYERLLKRLSQQDKEQHYIQPLLIPLTLDFSSLEAALLKEHLEILNGMGFGIQEFGEYTFIIDAVPDFLKKEDVKACLTTMIENLIELQDTRRVQREKEKQLALAACRSSLSSTSRLTIEEAQSLLHQLFDCESPFQCPLGKTTIAYLSTEDLTRFFQK